MTPRSPGLSPPRFAERTLRLILGDGPDADSIVGDLFQEHREIADRRGRLAANIWYWGQLAPTGLGYARPGVGTVEELGRDVRLAARGLARQPAFTLSVVATLALGIGATSAVFSVVDGVLLRPLPFDDPEELVRVWASHDEAGNPYVDLMYSDIPPFAEAAAFESAAGLSVTPRVLMDENGDDRENILVARATPGLWETLGVEPILGRVPTDADAASGAALLVLSHRVWVTRFGSRADVIGTLVHLGSRGFEVVGVLPRDRAYPEEADAFRVLTGEEREDDDREVHLVARLREGVSVVAANAEAATIAAGLAERSPETHANLGAWLQPLQSMVVRDVRSALLALFGAVGLLLLIACVNTASLLLARATRRARNVAVRTALGASRPRIVREAIVESSILALAGGAAGLLLGRAVLGFMLRVGPELPRASAINLDLRVVAVMLTVTGVAGLLFGIGPALHAAGTPPQRTFRESSPGRRSTGGLGLQSGLVATEVALSTILAVLALLLFTTFRNAVTYDRGFSSEGLVALTIDPMHPPETGDATRAYFDEIVERVRRLPGVADAALSSHPLLEARGFRVEVGVAGQPEVTPTPTAHVNVVSHGFFQTAGVALVEGSGFSAEGGTEGDAELIVNERFVTVHLTDGPAVGTFIELEWISGRVIGVVRDVRTRIGEPALPKAYVSTRRTTVPGMSLTVRTEGEGEPAALVPALRREIQAAGPDVFIEDVEVVSQFLRNSVAPRRFQMWLLLSFATLALALAAVGIHGVTALSVAARRSEIGIRRALGESDRRVALRVLGRVAALTGVGTLLGLVGAGLGSELVASLLVGVRPTEPRVLAAVVVLLASVAALASLVPVLRALSVDPTESLRGD